MKKLLIILSVLGFFLFSTTLVLAGNPPDQGSSTYNNPSGSTPADGSTQASITVTLHDSSNNAVEGDSVSLSAPSDGSANFNNPQTTNTSGQVTFTMTSINAGTDEITLTDSTTGTTFTNWFTVTFTTAATASPSPTPLSCSAVPAAPVLSSVVSNANYQATLTWKDSADPISNYLVAYGVTSGKYIYGDPNIGSQGTTSFTVGSLGGNKKYYFVVSANNPCGISGYSNEVAVVVNPVSATAAPTVKPTTMPDTSGSDNVTGIATDTPQPTDTPTSTPSPTPAAVAQDTKTTFRNIGIGIVVLGIFVIGSVFVIQKMKKKNRIPPMGGDSFRQPGPPIGDGLPPQQNPPFGNNIPQQPEQPDTPMPPNQFG